MTKFNKQILRQAFVDAATEGAIFTKMSDMPWSGLFEDGILLDNMYFNGHSGDKFCSNIVYAWMNDNGEVTELGKEAIALMLKRRFIKSWQHLWDAYSAEYELGRDWYTHEEYTEDDTLTYGKKRDLKNASSRLNTEKAESTDHHDNSRTEDNSETTDDTRIDDLKHAENNQHNIFGFNTNSESGVPSEKNTGSSSDTGTQQTIGATQSQRLESDSGISGTNSDRTNESTESTEDSEVYSGADLRDKGGTTESYGLRAHSIQDLLASEKTLWLWDYFRMVFNDIDSVICLKVYEPSFIRRNYTYKEGW